MRSYATRLKGIGYRPAENSRCGWVYLSRQACEWLDVKPGERVRVIPEERNGFRCLILVRELVE